MNTLARKIFVSAAVGWSLLPVAWAASSAKPIWTLATDDTVLKLSVSNNRIYIDSFKNRAQGWNWTPGNSEVPLPGKNCIKPAGTPDGNDVTPNWSYLGATEEKGDRHSITLHFASAAPRLELTSVWTARHGPGPVENQITIRNTSGGQIVYSPDIAAGALQINADKSARLWSFEKTSVGPGHISHEAIGPGIHRSIDSRSIPLIVLDSGSAHGAYIGFEWELGSFQVTSAENPLDVAISVFPVTEPVTQGADEIFMLPAVYYGTYQGDVDDGCNHFKKWFWNYKITRSLHDHANEPWTEVCMQDFGGNGSASVTGATQQRVYDALAATGVECVKFDFWDGTGKCWYTDRDWMFHPEVWPNGFDYAAKAHRAGLKASLYMGGTYKDCDLTTIAGRDAELAAVADRVDKGWFDIWRTDLYTAPKEPIPQTYNGVSNFLFIMDHLIEGRPGFRYENCCNGGKYKGFAICRRMTFCTMNDSDHDAWITRTTFYSDSFAINPVQLKSDLGPADNVACLRTDMMGSILTWAADNPIYRQYIALYKSRQRPILRGADVYHILPMADGVNWDGLEYFNTSLNKGSVFLFKPSAKAVDGDSKVIKLKGLNEHKRYSLSFQDRTNLNCRKTGQELMDNGITVNGMTGNDASEIIWIN